MDFLIKNKKVVGVVLVLFFLIVALLVTSLSRGGGEVEDSQFFPSVNEERALGTGIDDFFANPGERWVDDDTSEKKVPLLRAITTMPVAGASIVEKRDGVDFVQYVRFTEYTKGHEFETPLAVIGKEEKISTETHTRIGDVLWNRKGNALVTRHHDKDGFVVRSHLGFFNNATTGTLIEYSGRDLVGAVIASAFSPDGTRLFYLVKQVGGSVGYVESVKTGARTQLWASALTSLNVRWDSDTTILIYTKPSSVAIGAVWSIDPVSGRESVLLVGDTALAPLMNPLGTKVFYSSQEQNTKIFTVGVLDVETRKKTKLPFHTFVEKCAWGPEGSKYVYCAIPEGNKGGDFLEKWYMGVESSSDILWRIDTMTGVVKMVLNPKEEIQEEFDIVDIRVSPKEDYLIFRTLDDAVLWGLQLPQKNTIVEEVDVQSDQ